MVLKDIPSPSIITVCVGFLDTNCYIVFDPETRAALVIDPGDDHDEIISRVRAEQLLPVAVVNTHGHIDHILADAEVSASLKVPVWIHAEDAFMLAGPEASGGAVFGISHSVITPGRLLSDGDILEFGRCRLTVLHTPGHTRGGICLLGSGLLFTGDTLFAGSAGRTDLEGGSDADLMRSLSRLRDIPGDPRVLAGHGPSSDLARERAANPYLSMVWPDADPS